MRGQTPRLTGLLTVLALILAACTSGSGTTATTGTTLPGGGVGNRPPLTGRHLLVSFDACEPFLDYVISQAVELVGPYGLDDPRYGPWGPVNMEFDTMALAAEEGGSRSAQFFSGTNVQVFGVDEPDIVKTDGERIVALVEGVLVVVDVTGSEPEVVSRLRLENLSVQNLFLSGDTVLLFGSAWGGPIPMAFAEVDAEIAPVFQTPTMQIIEVDISGDAEIVRTMTVDGQFVSHGR